MHFEHETSWSAFDFEGFIDLGDIPVSEFDVDDDSDNFFDTTDMRHKRKDKCKIDGGDYIKLE